MLFRKRRKLTGAATGRDTAAAPVQPTEFYPIDFEMMVKGHIIKRGSKQVRQIGITVHGATRLVTSGDVVDRDTYEALMAAGVLRTASPPPNHE